MNHINQTNGYFDTSDHKEEEANVFATRLLYPQDKKTGKSSILLSFLLLLSIAFGCFTYTKTFWPASAPQEPIIQVAEPAQEIEAIKGNDFLDELITKVEAVPEKPTASPKTEVTEPPTQIHDEQPVKQETAKAVIETAEQVVVTRTGRKYHKPNCSYLKNKTGTTTYTITEAEENYYAPCSRCFEN